MSDAEGEGGAEERAAFLAVPDAAVPMKRKGVLGFPQQHPLAFVVAGGSMGGSAKKTAGDALVSSRDVSSTRVPHASRQQHVDATALGAVGAAQPVRRNGMRPVRLCYFCCRRPRPERREAVQVQVSI